MVLAIDHQHHRPLVDRIAGLGADAGLPVLVEERHEIGDLLLELVRRRAGQRHLVPDHAGGGAERFHREPRRVGIGEVGQHQHRRRMLGEAVRHLLHGQPDVLEADLLADDIERRVREAVVHRAHHAQQHGAVADAGVEHPQRRRARMDVGEFQRDAVGHHPLFAAGVDEQQILLPVVEEAEVALRIGRAGCARRHGHCRRRSAARSAAAPGSIRRCASCARAITVGRMVAWRLVAMKARMRSSVSVVMRPPWRRRLASLPSLTARRPKVDSAKAGLPAIVGNFLQQLLGVHRSASRRFLGRSRAGGFVPSREARVAAKPTNCAPIGSTTKSPTGPVG